MLRYRCRCCHQEFDDPYVYFEKHGFYQPPYEKWVVCPYCLETDFDYATIVDQEAEEIEEEVEE